MVRHRSSLHGANQRSADKKTHQQRDQNACSQARLGVVRGRPRLRRGATTRDGTRARAAPLARGAPIARDASRCCDAEGRGRRERRHDDGAAHRVGGRGPSGSQTSWSYNFLGVPTGGARALCAAVTAEYPRSTRGAAVTAEYPRGTATRLTVKYPRGTRGAAATHLRRSRSGSTASGLNKIATRRSGARPRHPTWRRERRARTTSGSFSSTSAKRSREISPMRRTSGSAPRGRDGGRFDAVLVGQ